MDAGTAGKITNCQVGVFLSYAVPADGTRVLVDRELYVPRSWSGDRDRCAAAGSGQSESCFSVRIVSYDVPVAKGMHDRTDLQETADA